MLASPPVAAPVVSVVVPAHNSEATLGATLDALAAQLFDENFEVVVADDSSSDQSVEIARGREGVQVVASAGTGPGPARNAGVAAAGAPLIAFTDSDCFPDP